MLKLNKLNNDNEKYITKQEINNLMAENFTPRLKQANLATKLILLIS